MRTILHSAFMKFMLIVSSFLLAIVLNARAGGGHEKKPVSPSAKVSVKVYPNPSYGQVNITLKSSQKKEYQLFLFTAEGKLVRHQAIKNRQTLQITGLTKGYYTYDILNNDERMERGRLIVH
jgi:Secretion system C-terminal sorting domain